MLGGLLLVGVLGAMLATLARGMDNNVYTQIGLVLLVALVCKNAILIVEFAKLNFEEGKSAMEAALEAARLRLRPIVMTSFAFMFDCVPDPVCQTTSGKCSSSLPSITSFAA